MTVAERREREREERRTQILDAAQQVFHDRGVELATMDEVAEAAQLGKGTLYNYFRKKEDLLGGVAARHMRRMVAKYEQAGEAATDGCDLVRRMLLAYAEHMGEPIAHLKMAITRFTQGPPADPNGATERLMQENVMHLMSLYQQAIERGQQDGSIRTDLEPIPLCLKLWSCVNGALLLKLQLTHGLPPPQIQAMAPTVADTVDLLMDAICRRDVAVPISTKQAASQPARDGDGEASAAS